MLLGLKIQDRKSGGALLDVDEGADPPSLILHTLFVDGPLHSGASAAPQHIS
jgi:hypothetical protein